IGPYCVIGEEVSLAQGVTLKSHVVIDGRTTIGERTRIFPFASIGFETQDLKYKGEPSALEIGHDNTIREHVTINPGTEGGGLVIGDRARLPGINIIGMQRRGFSRDDIQGLRGAYQFLFSEDGTFNDRVIESAERFGGIGPVDDIIAFIRADSSRAICQPKGPNGG